MQYSLSKGTDRPHAGSPCRDLGFESLPSAALSRVMSSVAVRRPRGSTRRPTNGKKDQDDPENLRSPADVASLDDTVRHRDHTRIQAISATVASRYMRVAL